MFFFLFCFRTGIGIRRVAYIRTEKSSSALTSSFFSSPLIVDCGKKAYLLTYCVFFFAVSTTLVIHLSHWGRSPPAHCSLVYTAKSGVCVKCTLPRQVYVLTICIVWRSIPLVL